MVTAQSTQNSPDDPLAALEARIERAQRLEDTDSTSEPPAPDGHEGPLETLLARIETASTVPPAQPPGRAAEPLASIYESIGRAAELARQPQLGETDDSTPPDASTDPLDRLQARIGREIDEVGARSSVPVLRGESSTGREASKPTTDTAPGLEAAVGRELLQLVENRPLDGPARADALGRVTRLLNDVEDLERGEIQSRLRSLFELLLQGDSPD